MGTVGQAWAPGFLQVGVPEACQSPALSWARWEKMAGLEVVAIVEEGFSTEEGQVTEACQVEESR